MEIKIKLSTGESVNPFEAMHSILTQNDVMAPADFERVTNFFGCTTADITQLFADHCDLTPGAPIAQAGLFRAFDAKVVTAIQTTAEEAAIPALVQRLEAWRMFALAS